MTPDYTLVFTPPSRNRAALRPLIAATLADAKEAIVISQQLSDRHITEQLIALKRADCRIQGAQRAGCSRAQDDRAHMA